MKKKMFSKIISNVAISFFFMSIIVLCYYYLVDEKVSYYVNFINSMSVEVISEREVKTEYNFEAKRLINYPAFGSKYGSLKIKSIDMNLPIYHGDTLRILRYGVGHYAGSYFPGENGTIILDAHNTSNFFGKLDKIKKGDEIVIKTTYGTFKYIMEKSKVVKETDIDAFMVSHDKEMLIMYTCYPINRSVVGRKTKRYLVYAYKEGDTSE